jgi:hypothetical protein
MLDAVYRICPGLGGVSQRLLAEAIAQVQSSGNLLGLNELIEQGRLGIWRTGGYSSLVSLVESRSNSKILLVHFNKDELRRVPITELSTVLVVM